jgi:protoporphyrinogen oxidase
MPEKTDVLILGSGLTGLAAAWVLGDRATVLERDERPGGLVRTERFGDYWFDRVLHLLYFQDPVTEQRVRALMGDLLVRCPPLAWCETAAGTTRFPFQMNLRGLDPETRVRCVRDLAAATFRAPAHPPANFEQHLLATFGRAMCDVFLFPYNRKMWKRPLDTLAPSGFTWNITPPDLEQVLRGAFEADAGFHAYNSAGWYPRPPAGAPTRGMEVLSATLAREASDLRLGCEVESVDLARREVVVRRGGRTERLGYADAVLSTLPLPALIHLCADAPAGLRRACAGLMRNRVLSVALSVRGPRPVGSGHWRYYADESLIFTRLVFLHEFDPGCGPEDGWPLLVEITEPAETPLLDRGLLLARVRADLARVKAIPAGGEIVGQRVMVVDPAYVVFGLDHQPVVDAAQRFLALYGVTSLGRYGRWEYSGMSSCMRDGLAWAEALASGNAERALAGGFAAGAI